MNRKNMMAEYAAKRNAKRPPTHPGALLREDVIPATGKPKTEIAELLGISRQHLYDILDEKKPVTAPMAARIAKAFGGTAASWLTMQAAHDAWHAEREVDVSRIPVIRAA